MNRVSTAFAFQSGAADYMRAQGRSIEAQQQISNGKRGVDLKGFGRNSEMLIAAKSVQSRASGFVEMHKLLAGKLQAQDQSLFQIADKAEEAKQTLLGAVAAGRADNMMATLDTVFGQTVDALNWKHSGRYLFSGSQTDVEPVAIKTLAELENGATDLAFKNDEVRTENRLDDTSTLTTGFLADDVATELFDVLKSIQAFHEGPSGPLTGTLTVAQETFLKGKIAELGDAHEGLLARVAENGSMQQRLDDSTDAQAKRVGMLDTYIAEIAEVDIAEAFARAQQADLAVQASAQAFKALKESSLLYLLRD